ncbi:hypothetical protein DAEQUDRAFT_365447 [Daedalea quercina L-15889]|uniref:DUF6533 domain-containing protein n=1 Tax=Daedalea quercina L-15889 TaxID=1314783 RepID=A0A165P943_9APHY|nr:hypothetical protein DAEQUDRAFT_365447 [Daedalea quercina L-15889]
MNQLLRTMVSQPPIVWVFEIPSYELEFVQTYLVVALLTLISYDSFLTLDEEIRLFWSRLRQLPRAASCLFILIRGYQLAYVVFYLAPSFAATSSLPYLDAILTFALPITGMTLTAGMLDIYIASRVCAIACDLVVIATTWWATHRAVKSRLLSNRKEYTLSWYLMRDGTLYFVPMLVLNLIDISVFFYGEPDILTRTILYPFVQTIS